LTQKHPTINKTIALGIKFIPLLFVLAFSSIANAQSDLPDRFAMKTVHGVLVVWNQAPDDYFTLHVKGNEFKKIDDENVSMLMDGKYLQVQSLPIANFLAVSDKSKPEVPKVLEAHRDWEFEYLEKSIGKKLKMESERTTIQNGQPALFWWVEIPPEIGKGTTREVYLTVQYGGNIILLNSMVDASNTFTSAREFLSTIMGTLEKGSKPYDRQMLKDKIND
jgi:hypothetical protein